MPTTPYAKLLVSVDGGTPTSGPITATAGQTLQFSIENPTGVTGGYRWVLYDFPPDFPEPAGWSTDQSDGTFYSLAATPPVVTISLWGKFLPALFINGATNTSGDPRFRDTTGTAIKVLSPNVGMPGVSGLELQQFEKRGAFVDLMRSLQAFEEFEANAEGLAAVLGISNDGDGEQIKDIADPTDDQDAATKAYVDLVAAQDLENVLTLDPDGGGIEIENIGAPTSGGSATTRTYVDAGDAASIADAADYTDAAIGAHDLAAVLALGADADSVEITNGADPTSPQSLATAAYVGAGDAATLADAEDYTDAAIADHDLAAVLALGNSAGDRIIDLTDPIDPQDADTLAARTAAIQLNSFANNAALLAVTPTAGRVVTTRSQTDPNDPYDGGSGTWRALTGASAATYVHDEGTMLVAGDGSSAWQRVFEGRANGKWWGARGDGETDDTAAVHAAFDWGHANKRALYFPAGSYLVSEGWTTTESVGDLIVTGEKCGMYVWTNVHGGATAFRLTSTDVEDFFVQIIHNGTYHFEDLEFTGTSTPDQRFFRFSDAFGYLKFQNLLFANMGYPFAWEDGFYTHNAVFRDIVFRNSGTFFSEGPNLKCTGIVLDNLAHENDTPANSNQVVMDLSGLRMIDGGVIILEGNLPESGTWTILRVGVDNAGASWYRPPFGRIRTLHSEWPSQNPLHSLDLTTGIFEIEDFDAHGQHVQLSGSAFFKVGTFTAGSHNLENLITLGDEECFVSYENYNTRARDVLQLASLPYPLDSHVVIKEGFSANSDVEHRYNQAVLSPVAPAPLWVWDGGYITGDLPVLTSAGGHQPSVDATYGRRLELPFVGDLLDSAITCPRRESIALGQQYVFVMHIKAPTLEAGTIRVYAHQSGHFDGGGTSVTLESEEEAFIAVPTCLLAGATGFMGLSIKGIGTEGTTPGPVHIYTLGIYTGHSYPKKLYPNYKTNITTYWTAAPTAGTWNRGDIVHNTAPAANGTLGWVCTTAGTPGTWRAFGDGPTAAATGRSALVKATTGAGAFSEAVAANDTALVANGSGGVAFGKVTPNMHSDELVYETGTVASAADHEQNITLANYGITADVEGTYHAAFKIEVFGSLDESSGSDTTYSFTYHMYQGGASSGSDSVSNIVAPAAFNSWTPHGVSVEWVSAGVAKVVVENLLGDDAHFRVYVKIRYVTGHSTIPA